MHCYYFPRNREYDDGIEVMAQWRFTAFINVLVMFIILITVATSTHKIEKLKILIPKGNLVKGYEILFSPIVNERCDFSARSVFIFIQLIRNKPEISIICRL